MNYFIRLGQSDDPAVMDFEYVAHYHDSQYTMGTFEPSGRYWAGRDTLLAYFDDLHKYPGQPFEHRMNTHHFQAPEGWDKDGEMRFGRFQGIGVKCGRWVLSSQCRHKQSWSFWQGQVFNGGKKYLLGNHGDQLYVWDISDVQGGGVPQCNQQVQWNIDTPSGFNAVHQAFAFSLSNQHIGDAMWVFGDQVHTYSALLGYSGSFNMQDTDWSHWHYPDEKITKLRGFDNPLKKLGSSTLHRSTFNCPADFGVEDAGPEPEEPEPEEPEAPDWVLLKEMTVCRGSVGDHAIHTSVRDTFAETCTGNGPCTSFPGMTFDLCKRICEERMDSYGCEGVEYRLSENRCELRKTVGHFVKLDKWHTVSGPKDFECWVYRPSCETIDKFKKHGATSPSFDLASKKC